MPLPYQYYQVHGPPLELARKKTGLNEHPAPQPDPSTWANETNPDRRVGLREWFRTTAVVAVVVLTGIVVVSGTLSLPQLIVLIAGSMAVIRLLRGRVKVPTISPSQRVDVATRALAGEDKSTLAQELDVPPEWVAEWARAFKERGQSGVEGPAAPPLFDAGKWLSVLGPIILLTGLGVHISYYYYYWGFYRQLGLSPEEAGVSYADVIGRESVTIAAITGGVIFLVLVVAMGAWGLAKFTPPAIYTGVRELPWRIIGPLGAAALLLLGGPFLIKKFDQARNQSKKQVEDITAGQIAGPYNDAPVNLPINHVVLTGPRPTGPPAGQLMIRLGQANGITPILDPATGVLWRVPTATTPMVSSQSVFHLDLGDPKANNTRPAISNTRLNIKPDGTPILDTGEKQFQLVGVRTSEKCLVKGFFGDKVLKAFSEDSRGKGSPETEEIRRKARRAMKIVVFPIENDVGATTVDGWVFWASGGPALNVTLVQKGLASKGASARTPYGEIPATQKRLSC